MRVTDHAAGTEHHRAQPLREIVDGWRALLGNPVPLSEGQYRVELTYHRERSGQVHTFSQAGDRASERAVIDIPWQAR